MLLLFHKTELSVALTDLKIRKKTNILIGVESFGVSRDQSAFGARENNSICAMKIDT